MDCPSNSAYQYQYRTCNPATFISCSVKQIGKPFSKEGCWSDASQLFCVYFIIHRTIINLISLIKVNISRAMEKTNNIYKRSKVKYFKCAFDLQGSIQFCLITNMYLFLKFGTSSIQWVVHLANCPFCESSIRQIVHLENALFGDSLMRRLFYSAKSILWHFCSK